MNSPATRNNVEPIPGYQLRERLGAGGYGEVWKADAPGGLSKAIKFIFGFHDGERAQCELKALNRIKGLRHPFLISLERIEVVEGQLVVVTELADRSLKDRYEQCRSLGMTGIPRAEMLIYMRDAADALDFINEQHSLQHLDIKPENLLLIGEHVKVADFGLVKSMQDEVNQSLLAGLTPLYASPEMFNAEPSRKSDQYSLAVLYVEMITGTLPFPGKTTAQLASRHISSPPLLHQLNPGDRKVIARALAKEPSRRFTSCREFVDFLSHEVLQESLPSADSWFSDLALTPQSGQPAVATAAQGEENFGATQRLTAAENGNVPRAFRVTEIVRRNTEAAADQAEEETPIPEELLTHAVATAILAHNGPPEITDLPCVFAENAPLAPTIFIGVGRFGGIALQRLKQRLSDRYRDGIPAAWQFLLIDADPHDLMRARRGDDGGPLREEETLAVPLRKTQDYRNESGQLLRWLSRRWLYNIPRTQKTEGMRPLGRLAFVDHSRAIRERIEAVLKLACSHENREASAIKTHRTFDRLPRAYVIGASCGGTSGGMLLDLCRMIGDTLAKQGRDRTKVSAVMMHCAGRGDAAQLAVVNSHAVLSELAHYVRPDQPYPGDPACGFEAEPKQNLPVGRAWFVNFGRQLNDRQIFGKIDQVAMKLAAETVAGATPLEDRGSQPFRLDGFGTAELSGASGEFASWAAMNLVSDLFSRWSGDDARTRTEAEQIADRVAAEAVNAHGLAFASLIEEVETHMNRLLPIEDTQFLQGLLTNDASSVPFEGAITLERIDKIFGKLGDDFHGNDSSKLPQVVRKTLELLEADIAKRCSAMSELLNELTEHPGARTIRSERAAKKIAEVLLEAGSAARELRKNAISSAQSLEHQLGLNLDPQDSHFKTKIASWKKASIDHFARFSQYVRLRLQALAAYATASLALRLRIPAGSAAERIIDFKRELKGIASTLAGDQPPSNDLDAVALSLQDRNFRDFTNERTQLGDALDTWAHERIFSAEVGFLATLTRSGEQRAHLTSELFQAARQLVLAQIGKFGVTSFLIDHQADGDKDQGHRIAALLDMASLHPIADGNRRTLIFLPEGTSSEEIREFRERVISATRAEPKIVLDRDSGVRIVRETDGHDLAETATRLLDGRCELAELSKRVYSRNDIAFAPPV